MHPQIRLGEGGGAGLREGAEPTVSVNFYRTVVQVVLFFGVETWFLTDKTSKRIKVAHESF